MVSKSATIHSTSVSLSASTRKICQCQKIWTQGLTSSWASWVNSKTRPIIHGKAGVIASLHLGISSNHRATLLPETGFEAWQHPVTSCKVKASVWCGTTARATCALHHPSWSVGRPSPRATQSWSILIHGTQICLSLAQTRPHPQATRVQGR